jgi:hypothetical protein
MCAPTYFGVEPTRDEAAEPAPRGPAPNDPRPAPQPGQNGSRPVEAGTFLQALLHALAVWPT